MTAARRLQVFPPRADKAALLELELVAELVAGGRVTIAGAGAERHYNRVVAELERVGRPELAERLETLAP